ncbi:N-6 DNA methylase [Flavobacterium collinsii]|nr:N-6 DNA methylase [Flavobacterium collinsii]
MKNATKFLSLKCPANPWFVDRLIISAFLALNNIDVEHNHFILTYRIEEEDQQEFDILHDFLTVLNNDIRTFDIEALIELFEFVISPSDRIVNGAIYTPSDIRNYIVEQSLYEREWQLEDIKISDISCGCGGFLYTAARELKRRTQNSYEHIYQNQIFGLDIQEYSVTRSRLLLSLLALSEGEDVEQFHFNIHHGDTLVFNWNNIYPNFEGFQIIVGNPPYVRVRNLDDAVKENLQNWAVCASGNPDLYIPFFQIGFESLAPNGVLGYITMNSFFKSLNGRALRSYFAENNVAVKIIDFGTLQIFQSKSTYTCICFLENTQQEFVEYYKSIDRELPMDRDDYIRIDYNSLNARSGWNLNNNELISKIEATGRPLGEIYKTRHGIATLKNDLYIFKPVAEDEDFYYLQNGNLYPIEKGICRDIFNSNKLSRSVDIEQNMEKVLFPYSNDDRPKVMEEDFLREKFPMAYNYLLHKKSILATRDKGYGKYEKWFAFGRTQSLEKMGNKLFFPKFSDKIPSYVISNDNDLLFYNGQAIIGHSDEEMLLIKKIMESRIFWYYIKTTSKPYTSNYYSLNGNYIKNFGIPDFSEEQIDFLINEHDKQVVDDFLEDFYNVDLCDEQILN